MNVVFLAVTSESWTTSHWRSYLHSLGHKTMVVDPRTCAWQVGPFRMWSKENETWREIPEPNLVIPRFGWATRKAGLRCLQAWESANVPTCNSSRSIHSAGDKLLCLQILSAAGYSVPRTVFAANPTDFFRSRLVRTDLPVFKSLNGSQGFGVAIARSKQDGLALSDLLRNENVEYIAQSRERGEEVRAVVWGDKVVAVAARKGRGFRKNVQQGGDLVRCEMSDGECEFVMSVAQCFGLSFAAVDFFRQGRRRMILEVNPFPGLQRMSRLYRTDLTKRLEISNLVKSNRG